MAFLDKSGLEYLWGKLKNTFALVSHEHEIDDVTGLQTALDSAGTVKSVNGKTGVVSLSASDVGAREDTWLPTAAQVGAAASTHGHAIADVTGLSSALSGKASYSHNHLLSSVLDENDVALDMLLDGKSDTTHTHTAADIGALAKASTSLSPTSDLDSLYTTGIYRWSQANCPQNAPATTASVCFVIGDNATYTMQIVKSLTSDGKGKVYIRSGYNTAYQNWKIVPYSDDAMKSTSTPLVAGDDLNNYYNNTIISWTGENCPTNAPESATGGVCLVCGVSTTHTIQICQHLAADGLGKAYMRHGWGGAYKQWRRISDSGRYELYKTTTAIDFNTMKESGHYLIGTAAHTNGPITTSGASYFGTLDVDIELWSNGYYYGTQTFKRVSGTDTIIYTRNVTKDVWGNWVMNYTSGNLTSASGVAF